MSSDLHTENNRLIKELIHKGISHQKVLDAIAKVPRENFISAELRLRAYEDNALPIDCGQTISQPYTVAFMTELLDVQLKDRILEIGTGSGYQAAILAELGAIVYSVECISELHDRAKNCLSGLGYSINQKLGDGTMGWVEESPFDKIIVTAGAPDFPNELINQLKISGLMVIPIGDKQSQTMFLVSKSNENELIKIPHNEFRFVPLIGKFGWQN